MNGKIDIKKRDNDIVNEYKNSNKTMQEIADENNITRQRVDQILKRNGVENKFRTRKPETFICQECGEKFTHINRDRKFCSKKCVYLNKRKYKTKEQIEKHIEDRRIENARRYNFYYHNIFKKRENWRKIISERNKKYKKK